MSLFLETFIFSLLSLSHLSLTFCTLYLQVLFILSVQEVVTLQKKMFNIFASENEVYTILLFRYFRLNIIRLQSKIILGHISFIGQNRFNILGRVTSSWTYSTYFRCILTQIRKKITRCLRAQNLVNERE